MKKIVFLFVSILFLCSCHKEPTLTVKESYLNQPFYQESGQWGTVEYCFDVFNNGFLK